MELVLEMRNISKRFTGVQALKEVNLKLYAGEIHSIIGQNGAGKSTLMKILSGNYRHDEGEILIRGEEVQIHSPSDAARLGIGIVHQELSLLNNLTVAENIFLGREEVNGICLDNKKMNRKAQQYLEEMGIRGIDVNQNVEAYPLAKQQLIEIAKVLSAKPDILILDEPTAALTNEDTERLFQILFRLKKQGIAVVFISHRLGEIKRYCDCGTILMNGRVTASVRMDEVDEGQIIEYMLGDAFDKFHREQADISVQNKKVLELQGIGIKRAVSDVDCTIYGGTITGFTGLLGAGQDVLWRAVYGDIPMEKGKILLGGREVQIRNPNDAVRAGIGLLTENRKEEGIFPQMSVLDNIALPSLYQGRMRLGKFFLNYRKIQKEGDKLTESLALKMRNFHTKIKFLSGGNQQKALVSRWLMRQMEILVFLEPTRGVDVGAKAEIYRILERLAKEGKAIVVVSTDTSEILQVSDRIVVMCDGRISSILEKPADEESLAQMIQGREVRHG
ncbi:MAG: sugar ABC transporter ATP-binding protein [Eubacteriales bacterium]|nr:sugar ABC transporter ATP-binding protein [Eubacteriales bacterium]